MQGKSGGKHEGHTVVKKAAGKHHHDEHGGAWKVAFADFCLALSCLFIVLWLMAQREYEAISDLAAVSGSAFHQGAGAKPSFGQQNGPLISRNLESTMALKQKAPGEDPYKLETKKFETEDQLKKLARAVAQLVDEAGLTDNLQLVITPEGLRIVLHDTDKQGMFARGSAMPSPQFREVLYKLGPLFQKIENQLLILGHTDSVQYMDRGASGYSNWSLSNQRAMSARVNLLGGGMPQESVLQVVGMADRAPLDASRPEAGVNRRIELMVLTSKAARNLSTMFGVPETVRTIADGVGAVTAGAPGSKPAQPAQGLETFLGPAPAGAISPR